MLVSFYPGNIAELEHDIGHHMLGKLLEHRLSVIHLGHTFSLAEYFFTALYVQTNGSIGFLITILISVLKVYQTHPSLPIFNY